MLRNQVSGKFVCVAQWNRHHIAMAKTSKLTADEVFRNNRAIYSQKGGTKKGANKIFNIEAHSDQCSCRTCRRSIQKIENRLKRKRVRGGQ